jgi:hypothetical protein
LTRSTTTLNKNNQHGLGHRQQQHFKRNRVFELSTFLKRLFAIKKDEMTSSAAANRKKHCL